MLKFVMTKSLEPKNRAADLSLEIQFKKIGGLRHYDLEMTALAFELLGRKKDKDVYRKNSG